MWTYVGPGAEVAVEGFAVDEVVDWAVRTDDHSEELPALPDGFDGQVAAVEDGDLDLGPAATAEALTGTVRRILMLSGRRRTTASEITATPAEHVQVLDLAGFLVEVEPDPT